MYGGGASSQPRLHRRVSSRKSRDDAEKDCGELESWYAGVRSRLVMDILLLDDEDMLLLENLRGDMLVVNCW